MNFAMKILTNLFYYKERVFIRMNTWIVRKNSMRHHCLMEDITDVDYRHEKNSI